MGIFVGTATVFIDWHIGYRHMGYRHMGYRHNRLVVRVSSREIGIVLVEKDEGNNITNTVQLLG